MVNEIIKELIIVCTLINGSIDANTCIYMPESYTPTIISTEKGLKELKITPPEYIKPFNEIKVYIETKY